jgi:hypothetical protein
MRQPKPLQLIFPVLAALEHAVVDLLSELVGLAFAEGINIWKDGNEGIGNYSAGYSLRSCRIVWQHLFKLDIGSDLFV